MTRSMQHISRSGASCLPAASKPWQYALVRVFGCKHAQLRQGNNNNAATNRFHDVDMLLDRAWMMDAPWPQLQLVHFREEDVFGSNGGESSSSGGGGGGDAKCTASSSRSSNNVNNSSSGVASANGGAGGAGGSFGGDNPPQAQASPTVASLPLLLLRDDLLHPYLGGNKLRKLDALLPEAVKRGARHLVTCGGLQSAHTAAVAAAAAERGLCSHLLVRGERPAVPTGYHLLTRMFGSVVRYIPRGEYADRAAMFERYIAEELMQQPGGTGAAAGAGGGQGLRPEEVFVIQEGAAMPGALLGFVRLARWMADGGGSGFHPPPAAGAASCAQTLPSTPAPGTALQPSSQSTPTTATSTTATPTTATSTATPTTATSTTATPTTATATMTPTTATPTTATTTTAAPTATAAPIPTTPFTAAPTTTTTTTASAATPAAFPLNPSRPVTVVVDSGTGATAVGLAIGFALLRLPWRVVGVMLAPGGEAYYQDQAERLAKDFASRYLHAPSGGSGRCGVGGDGSEGRGSSAADGAVGDVDAVDAGPGGDAGASDANAGVDASDGVALRHLLAALPVEWVERPAPRRFGKVLPGEVARCAALARATGVLLDPIYGLAGLEVAAALVKQRQQQQNKQVQQQHQQQQNKQVQQQHQHQQKCGDSGGEGQQGQSCGVDDEQQQQQQGSWRGGGKETVVYLHSGGGLGLFGLAQRRPGEF